MRESFAAMPMRNKLVLGVAAVGVLLALFLLVKAFTAPSYALLSSGMDPKDAGKVTAALDEQGIGYELRANGTSVAVEKAQVGKARIALADAGVDAGSSSGPGYELFDKQSMGASEMQQKVNYQRALEGEITRTVDGVEGVSQSQVQLVLPQDELFADEATPATAAVLIEGSPDALAPGAVRGIAQLVSSSVQGLKSSNVTITDKTGQVLWPAGDGTSDSGAMAGATKQAAEGRYASALEANLNAMLLSTVGPGKAQVQVNADLDMDKVTRDQLKYAKTGTPLKTTEESERLRGTGGAGGAGGATGTAGNVPSYAAGAAGGAGGNSNYQRRNGTTEFGVDKEVSKIEQAPGSVKKLNVALVLDRTVADAKGVQAAVAAAAGIDPARGDQISMTQMTFPKVETPSAGPVPAGLMTPLKWGALGLAGLIFLLLSWRTLRKREADALADPEWLREINEPVRLAELESQTRVMEPARRENELDQLESIAEREPERVAAQLRTWMADD